MVSQTLTFDPKICGLAKSNTYILHFKASSTNGICNKLTSTSQCNLHIAHNFLASFSLNMGLMSFKRSRCLSQYVFYTFHILSHPQQKQQQHHPLEGLGLKNVEFEALLLCSAPRRLKNRKKCQMAANFEIKHGVPFLSFLLVAWVGLGLF